MLLLLFVLLLVLPRPSFELLSTPLLSRARRASDCRESKVKRSGTGVRRGVSRNWEKRSGSLFAGTANCRWARCRSDRFDMNCAAPVGSAAAAERGGLACRTGAGAVTAW